MVRAFSLSGKWQVCKPPNCKILQKELRTLLPYYTYIALAAALYLTENHARAFRHRPISQRNVTDIVHLYSYGTTDLYHRESFRWRVENVKTGNT